MSHEIMNSQLSLFVQFTRIHRREWDQLALFMMYLLRLCTTLHQKASKNCFTTRSRPTSLYYAPNSASIDPASVWQVISGIIPEFKSGSMKSLRTLAWL